MKALLFHGLGNISIDEVPIPEIGDQEVLIKVRACAICATDLRIFRGEKNAKAGLILGHEFSGDIFKMGKEVRDLTVGDRVGVYPIIADGKCDYCIRGYRNRCVNRKTIGIEINGGFAEYILIPADAVRLGHVMKLPQEISYEEATLLEPLSTVVNSTEKMDIGYGDGVLIIGAGPMGLMHVMLAKLRGATSIIVSDMVDTRLEIARRLGASHLINPNKMSLIDSLNELKSDYSVNKAILTIGIPGIVEQLLEVIQPQGRISLFAGGGKTYLSNIDLNKIHYKEIILTATQNATPEQFKKALRLMASGYLNIKEIISHRFPLEKAIEAFSLRDELKALKVVLTP